MKHPVQTVSVLRLGCTAQYQRESATSVFSARSAHGMERVRPADVLPACDACPVHCGTTGIFLAPENNIFKFLHL